MTARSAESGSARRDRLVHDLDVAPDLTGAKLDVRPLPEHRHLPSLLEPKPLSLHDQIVQLALVAHADREDVARPEHHRGARADHRDQKPGLSPVHGSGIGSRAARLKPTRIVEVKCRLLCLIALVLGTLAPAGGVRGQPDPLGEEGAEIELSLELFGAGGLVRPGDWAGLRVAARDPGAGVRQVALELEIPDADGDATQWRRLVTLNPGQAQGVWLYARLPATLRDSTTLRLTAREATEGADLAAAGRKLATVVISPQTVIDAASPLIGLIGRASAGLDGYRIAAPGTAAEPATGHEWIEFAILDPDRLDAALPDAWMGLAPMKTIVWTEGSPETVRAPAAAALAEWVRRGGHLVVVVPQDALGWTRPEGILGDILPRVDLVRREGVDLERYRPLLTPDAIPLPERAIVHELQPVAGAKTHEAAPILVGPSNEPLVVRRLAGAGAVTMIGLDVAQRELAARLDPQRFWHRVLGERFDVLSGTEVQALAQGTPPANFRSRTPVWIDDAVGTVINKTGRAGTGVLLGFVVFAAYWVVAGPGGFAILKWTGWARHSWLVFVGVAGVFTAIAWGGASALRPVKVEVTHLTFADHVFGQDVVRTRSWLGALLPRYGETRVEIERDPAWRHAMAPWEPPGTAADSFPDPRPYVIESRRPDAADFPSRATVKQLRLDWIGSPPWRSVVPSEPIELSPAGRLSGTVTHELPGALEDVVVMLVLRQQDFIDLPPSALQARTLAWSLAGDWAPGQLLDLGALGGSGASAFRGDAFLDRLTQNARSWAGLFGSADERTAFDMLDLLTWGPMIGPPDYRRQASATGFPAQVNRRFGHGLDLARWFTQPCLIVTGRVATPLPVPLLIDGETPPSSGRTVLRWVYPLPPAPPTFGAATP